MTPELAAQKKRLVIMGIANVVAVVVALAFVVVWVQFKADWAFFAFVGSLAAGFGAQIWFIAGFRRKGA